jgi:ATP-dependent DNA ligase
VLEFRNFPFQVVKHVRLPFDSDDWLFEIKHDGFRGLAIREGGSTRLFTRNGYDISKRHPQINSELNGLPADRFVLDGELVVLDDDGRTNFARLAHGRTGTHYYAFDLLTLGDADLRTMPLESRKAKLARLLDGSSDSVRYCALYGAFRDDANLARMPVAMRFLRYPHSSENGPRPWLSSIN